MNNSYAVVDVTPKPKTKTNTNTVPGKVGGSYSGTLVTPPQIDNPVGGKSLLQVGTNLINFMLAMIVIVTVVVIIVAGFRLMTAGGNETTITKSKRAILYALGGLAVALMSFAIVQIIQSFLGK